jgi:phosphoglycerol transferase
MMSEAGANFSMTYEIITKSAIDVIIFLLLPVLLFSIRIVFKKSNRIIYFRISKKLQRILSPSLAAAGMVLFFVNMGFPAYIASRNQMPSTFYEEHYIDPKMVEINFPEKKRNLIVIFIESLETGFLTREDGGAFSERLMPEIEKLARENINFSASAEIGGGHQLNGTSWTIAGIAAQYSGVPLNLGFDGNSYGSFINEFLPGAFCIGDILRESGYTSYFFLGSDIEFGGRDKYFTTHKNTVIYDYKYFVDNGYIPKDYHEWWGIEDRKLYTFAKEKIPEITGEEPFFITLLTADTHPSEMYLDTQAADIFNSRHKNVLFDMDSQLFDFLQWLKLQPFYENTTVAVLGDHLYMESDIFPHDFSAYIPGRFPLNIFINSSLSEEHTKNRLFSHFDMFPALVDSIGGIYDAPGLGLGRSMNKGEPTLLESLSVDTVNDTLRQKSVYYNKLWIGERNE